MRNITECEGKENENNFSTSEDEINDIESIHGGNCGGHYQENLEGNFVGNSQQNVENNFEKNLEEKFEENHEENLEKMFKEPYFNENFKLSTKYQIKSEKDDDDHNDDSRSPPEHPSINLDLKYTLEELVYNFYN